MWKMIKITPELHGKLKKLAKNQGLKIQWIVMQAIIEYLKECD